MRIKQKTSLIVFNILLVSVYAHANECSSSFANFETNKYQNLSIPVVLQNKGIPIFSVQEVFEKLPTTLSEFIELYGNEVSVKQPIVFRKAAAEWPDAMLTPDVLAKKYGDLSIVVSQDNMRTRDDDIFSFQERLRRGRTEILLKDFILNLTSNPYQSCHFVGKGTEFWSQCPEILAGCQLPSVEPFSSESNLLIVHKNKITTLHNHKATFLALFYGIKLVTLIDPIYKNYIYCTTTHKDDPLKCSSLVNVLNPDFKKYPDLKKITMQQVILFPGDVLYIPDHYFHYVLSLENSISISRFIAKNEKPKWNPHSEDFISTHCLATPIIAKTNPIKVLPVKEYQEKLPSLFSEFINIYGHDGIVDQPIVFREAASDWENMELNFHKLAEKFAHLPIEYFLKDENMEVDDPNTRLNIQTITMNEYVNLLKDNPHEAGFIVSNNKEFWENYGDLLLGTHFPNAECKSKEHDFFIVPKNKITYLHNHKATFLALFHGMKLVTLIDPKYKDFIYCSTSYQEDPLKCSSSIDVIDPNLQQYPNFKNVIMQQVILYPGDVLFIPKHYFHHVISLDNSISISKFISDRNSHNCEAMIDISRA